MYVNKIPNFSIVTYSYITEMHGIISYQSKCLGSDTTKDGKNKIQ